MNSLKNKNRIYLIWTGFQPSSGVERDVHAIFENELELNSYLDNHVKNGWIVLATNLKEIE
jgi:hypothetical protein